MVSKGKRETDYNEQKSETRSMSINEPCSSNNKGPIYEERRLQIEELDEWRAPVKEKPKTHEKSKRNHNEDRDRMKATPFTVMDIFPHGTVEVTHTVFGTFKVFQKPHGQAHGLALGRAHTTGGDTAVRDGRVKIERKCSPTRDSIRGHDCATWPWTKLSKQHRHATACV
ncbi:hypothetical protein GOBAR_AA13416 [Gossypium barbadense]|uniref:Uncharacterized protein n=1 Tax=Gossypium barbadense TaxID=3634 RepID=A0A2P5XV52_GOSBA|nr:hypothetical protein GOBAR_AA13416 [Gossypium barbadense]